MNATANKPVKVLGIVGLVAGLLMIVIGGTVWGVVTSQLNDQNVTVAEDASFAAGTKVNNPVSALAQADIINHHAMKATEGKTYAEMAQDDPARATAMNASFLRASLFTSVIAYGVAALVAGLGILFAINGFALTRVARGQKADAAPAVGAPALAVA